MTMNFNDLKHKAEEYHSWMVEIRRHLHRNPEVSYQEHDTTEFIVGKLAELGIRTERPLQTGCIGILPGRGADSSGEAVPAGRVTAGKGASDPEGVARDEPTGSRDSRNVPRVIALRADIDALAMDEQGDHKKEILSVRPGVAHCCGHDAHTA